MDSSIQADGELRDIRAYAEATNLEGGKYTFVDDLERDELHALLQLAEIFEPFHRVGLNLLEGKELLSLFFEPSTRTRFSHETAMNKLGGSVLTENDPQKQSSVKKGESLKDMMRTISHYADILVMRHPDSDAAIEAIEEASIPVISGGYGNITHPTQGLLDLYTIWKRVENIEDIDVLITSPDLSRARSGQSLALGLGIMGANITYASPSELPTPDDILDKQASFGADVTEHFDVTRSEHDELVKEHDFVYLPGCRIPEGDPKRDLYMEHKDSYYIGLETLREAKEESGRSVKLMHSLPRFEGEFDFDIDDTEHALYFDQVPNGIPIRMALLTAMVGI